MQNGTLWGTYNKAEYNWDYDDDWNLVSTFKSGTSSVSYTHLDVYKRQLYNYVDAQLFDIRNIDLPRKVKYRPRYKQPEFKVDRGCRIGRNYADFQKFLGDHPETTIVQMDSVIGRVGGKCLLTIHFVETSFMLAFLRDANTSASVIHLSLIHI